jgi:hypothetical protein
VGQSPSAAAQVNGYANLFREHAGTLMPLFGEIAAMMGELYGCYDTLLLNLDHERVDGLLAVEAGDGAVTIAEVTADAAMAS